MIVDIKIKGVWLKVDILGISGGWSDLTEDTTVDLASFFLRFEQGGNEFLTLDPASFNSKIASTDGTANGYLSFTSEVGNEVIFSLYSNDGTNEIKIEGDAIANTIAHEAASHIFTGKINNNTLQEFADDAAAITGGLEPGDFYYTEDSGSGFLKVVLPAI